MKLDQAQKLMLMFDLGYLVKIDAGIYEDQPAYDIHEATEEDIADNPNELREGDIVYSSSVFSNRPLRKVSVDEVKTYIPFDWQNQEVDPNKDVTIDDLPF